MCNFYWKEFKKMVQINTLQIIAGKINEEWLENGNNVNSTKFEFRFKTSANKDDFFWGSYINDVTHLGRGVENTRFYDNSTVGRLLRYYKRTECQIICGFGFNGFDYFADLKRGLNGKSHWFGYFRVRTPATCPGNIFLKDTWRHLSTALKIVCRIIK